jgi:K+-transporting ATPase ATPase A chain
MGLLVFVVLVVGGLTFAGAGPGPVIEHLQMLVGQLYA